jgi:hypothetical protein
MEEKLMLEIHGAALKAPSPFRSGRRQPTYVWGQARRGKIRHKGFIVIGFELVTTPTWFISEIASASLDAGLFDPLTNEEG